MLTHITRLYVGRCIPGREELVTHDELAAFEREVMSARFGDGWTRFATQGGWRDAASGKPITEPGMVYEVAHDGGFPARVDLAAAAASYKKRFHQDAVMAVTTQAEVQFV